MKNYNPRGSSFDDFLREEGIFEECSKLALLKISDWDKQEISGMIDSSMENFKKNNVSKPIDLSEFSEVEAD